MSLEKIAAKYLFKPEGMNDTHFYWDVEGMRSRFAIAHDKEKKEIPIRDYSQASAADLLMTTIHDYTKFGLSVLKKKGLKSNVYNEMIRYQSKDKKFGLGWEIIQDLPNKEFAFIHTGSDPGVRSIIILLPNSKSGMVVFTNSDNGMALIGYLVQNIFTIGNEILKSGK